MIENPPKITQSILAEELLSNLEKEKFVDCISKINNEYLYWSDVKYRAKFLDVDKEDLWKMVKYVRMKTDVKINGFDNIHFSLTNFMQRYCHEFDMNFGGSWGSFNFFPEDKNSQELYLVSSIMEEAIASSQMEGAATTRKVAKDMLRKKISPRDKSQRMILNNYNTINFICDHAKEDLTPEPPSACLPQFVEQLCAFFNDKSPVVFIHPIIRGIIIHFLIGYYHPFADGNGRTARALFYWYMVKNDYWMVQYLSISRIIKGSKKAYEKAFIYSEQDSNDIGYFIRYNLDVLGKSFDELKKYLIRKQKEKKKSERLLLLGNISPRQAEILNLYIENSGAILTSIDVMGKFGVSAGTAKSDLRNLMQKGYLYEIPLNGRTKGYVRSETFHEKVKQAKV